jgi:Mrp family chromosome partitioning ATPase
MTITTANQQAGGAAKGDAAGHTNGASTRANWLHTNPRGGALSIDRAATPLESLFPEADEILRGIYTSAGTGFAFEVLAICSAIAGEGKTTVAIGLAVTIAQDFPDRRVLLVETDLQRPVLSEDFEIDVGPGLLGCLTNGEPLLTACRPTFLENLHVLPAGVATNIVGRPLRSSQMGAIVDAMRQSYHMVILDLPAILTNSDAVLLTDLADGVICVIRAGSTPVQAVNRAVEQIEMAKLRGVEH